MKTVALPKLDSIHNVSSNSTGPLEKIYDNWNSDHQEHGNCTYGSGMNQVNMSITTNTFDHDQHHDTITMQLTMTYITFTGWLSYAGCYAASLSSAIASLIGAPRILQVGAQHPISFPRSSNLHALYVGFRQWARMGSTLGLVGLKRVAMPTTTQSEVPSFNVMTNSHIFHLRLLSMFFCCDGLCDDCQSECDRNCCIKLLPCQVSYG